MRRRYEDVERPDEFVEQQGAVFAGVVGVVRERVYRHGVQSTVVFRPELIVTGTNVRAVDDREHVEVFGHVSAFAPELTQHAALSVQESNVA